MKTGIAISPERTLITLAPENDTDAQAVRLLCILPNMSIVRRQIKGERVTCLSVEIAEEEVVPTMFDEPPGNG